MEIDKRKIEIEAMRERSGKVMIENKLVSFLYTLMRDYLPVADVETLVQNSHSEPTLYTNGWLARYAEDLANRIENKGDKTK